MADIKSDVATAIRRARIARGMSQGDLARKLRVTRQRVSYLEDGRGNPSIKTLLRLAEVLDLTVRVDFEPSETAKFAWQSITVA